MINVRGSKSRFGLILFGVAAANIWIVGPLAAQRGAEGRRDGERPDRAQLEQRMRAQMARMMKERLGLTDAQGEQLSGVVQGFAARRGEMGRSEQATRRRIEALMLDGGTDEDEALELLVRMAELRAEEATLLADEQEALLEVISPIQLLQMQALREQLGRRIRTLRGRGEDQRGVRRRGGGSDGRPIGPERPQGWR